MVWFIGREDGGDEVFVELFTEEFRFSIEVDICVECNIVGGVGYANEEVHL